MFPVSRKSKDLNSGYALLVSFLGDDNGDNVRLPSCEHLMQVNPRSVRLCDYRDKEEIIRLLLLKTVDTLQLESGQAI